MSRRGYKHVAACGDKLVEVLHAKGPHAAVDVDHACLCETIDTIGLYGFRHSFNALGCSPVPVRYRLQLPDLSAQYPACPTCCPAFARRQHNDTGITRIADVVV